MELFQKKIGPVFLKEDSEAEVFINKMTDLSNKATGRFKEEIDKQIKLASYGLIGEKNIAFELKNSDIDMYILHDVYFEYKDMSAQIDYITKKDSKPFLLSQISNLFYLCTNMLTFIIHFTFFHLVFLRILSLYYYNNPFFLFLITP